MVLKIGDEVIVNVPLSRYVDRKGKVAKIGLYSEISEKHYDYGVKLGKRVLGFNKEELERVN